MTYSHIKTILSAWPFLSFGLIILRAFILVQIAHACSNNQHWLKRLFWKFRICDWCLMPLSTMNKLIVLHLLLKNNPNMGPLVDLVWCKNCFHLKQCRQAPNQKLNVDVSEMTFCWNPCQHITYHHMCKLTMNQISLIFVPNLSLFHRNHVGSRQLISEYSCGGS